MTRKEQLDWLCRLRSDISYMDFSIDVNVSLERKRQYRQALSEVIKVLEQGSCEDAISRKAVLEMAKSYNADGWDMYTPLVVDVEDIEELPSVTPQPCEDAISRADAIKAMQDKAKKLTNEDTINGLCGAVAILFDLPSVTPQEPRKGHWLHRPHVYGVAYCSICDFELKIDNTNYCPNCGAKMEEVEE